MKTHAARHGDPRHHADDIAKLKAENRRLHSRIATLNWGEPEDFAWHKDYMTWLCRCGAEVSVTWTSSCSLYDTDEPIKPEDANASWWNLGCQRGHVLLQAHEMAEGEDVCPAPTTAEIVGRLASSEDVAAWRVWAADRAAKRAS